MTTAAVKDAATLAKWGSIVLHTLKGPAAAQNLAVTAAAAMETLPEGVRGAIGVAEEVARTGDNRANFSCRLAARV